VFVEPRRGEFLLIRQVELDADDANDRLAKEVLEKSAHITEGRTSQDALEYILAKNVCTLTPRA
jgi:hypothetical protein